MKKHIKIRRFEFFTMIELMAVLVIAAILLTLGASSFMKSRDNDATNRAASSFAGVLQQAQANAVARRKSVALLVHVDDNDDNDNDNDNDDTLGPPGTVYRLCYLKKGTNEFEFESWLSEEWKKLPSNTILAEVIDDTREYDKLDPTDKDYFKNTYQGKSDDDLLDLKKDNTDTKLTTIINVAYQKKVKTEKETKTERKAVPGIVFTPEGGLNTGYSINFYIIRGFIADGKLMIPNRTIDGKPLDFVRIRLNPFTGKAKVIQ